MPPPPLWIPESQDAPDLSPATTWLLAIVAALVNLAFVGLVLFWA
ncbi:hypothetical protein ABIA96_006508 [Bradyrhizobium sp. LB11.1]